MSAFTKDRGELYVKRSPMIFFSQGDPELFTSELLTGQSKVTEVESNCVVCNINSDLFLAYYSFPDPERDAKHALYDFSEDVSRIREVKAVTYQVEGNIIRVWTFIIKDDKQVRRQIYKKELSLMESFPDLIFDFNVISTRSSSEPFIPEDVRGYLAFYRKVNGERGSTP